MENRFAMLRGLLMGRHGFRWNGDERLCEKGYHRATVRVWCKGESDAECCIYIGVRFRGGGGYEEEYEYVDMDDEDLSDVYRQIIKKEEEFGYLKKMYYICGN